MRQAVKMANFSVAYVSVCESTAILPWRKQNHKRKRFLTFCYLYFQAAAAAATAIICENTTVFNSYIFIPQNKSEKFFYKEL